MLTLVTGVTGQVGGALVKVLAPANSIVAAGRDQLDLAEPTRIASALNRIGPDLIVNAAAFTAVDRAEDEKEMAFRVNAEAPGAIAQWAALRNVPVIHFSTDYVFDGQGSGLGAKTTRQSRCPPMVQVNSRARRRFAPQEARI